ncbi:MAG: hypothetical protein CVU74_09390 [Deltaproteobacteria bacterium HGW-Deltaproteobacteria-9]|nr:MAG: hypothetical protein CVU74_09390 [Deltaproteobacteria bacterium HGW-Deltaproteobacteria-9]
MSEFRKDYAVVIAVLAEMLAVAIVLSTPGMILAEGVSAIDTRADLSTGTGIFVRTKMDFASNESLKKFPKTVGEGNDTWESYSDYPRSSQLAVVLDAETMIFRPYTPDGYVSVDFLAVLSTNVSSFHPPEVCYQTVGQGWKVENSTIDYLTVTNATWIEDPLFPLDVPYNTSIPVRKLMISKTPEGTNTTHRQWVLYFYLKNSRLSVTNSIIMLRYSVYFGSTGVVNGTEALGLLKDFAGKSIPHLFEFRKQEAPIGAIIVYRYGFGGALLVSAMVTAPVGYVAYAPLTRWLRKRLGR